MNMRIYLIFLFSLIGCSDLYLAGIDRKGANDYDTIKDSTKDSVSHDTVWIHDPTLVISDSMIIDTISSKVISIDKGWRYSFQYARTISAPEMIHLYLSANTSAPIVGSFSGKGAIPEVLELADSVTATKTISIAELSTSKDSFQIEINAVNEDTMSGSIVVLQLRKLSSEHLISPTVMATRNIIFDQIKSIAKDEAVWIDNITVKSGDSLFLSIPNDHLNAYLVDSDDKYFYDSSPSIFTSARDGKTFKARITQNQNLALVIENKGSSIQTVQTCSFMLHREF